MRLLYANRDADVVIFRPSSTPWPSAHPDRLEVVHHLDVERGFVDAAAVGAVRRAAPSADVYVCGPRRSWTSSRHAAGRGRRRRPHPHRAVHAGRAPWSRAGAAGAPTDAGRPRVTIELDGRTETVDHHPGTTILQTARQMGMSPPFSCESGSCATCMARLVEGR